MSVNQNNEPVSEKVLFFPHQFEGRDLADAVLMLAQHLGMEFVKINVTKHDATELHLRKVEP